MHVLWLLQWHSIKTYLTFALMPHTSLALSCDLMQPIWHTLYLFVSSLCQWTLHHFHESMLSSFKFGTLKSTPPLLQFTHNGSPSALHCSSVFSVQECTGDSVYTSGAWMHTHGLAQADMLSSFVHNMTMDAWQEDQVSRMKVRAPLTPGHCHAHTASVAQRQHATHACMTTLWKADTWQG